MPHSKRWKLLESSAPEMSLLKVFMEEVIFKVFIKGVLYYIISFKSEKINKFVDNINKAQL